MKSKEDILRRINRLEALTYKSFINYEKFLIKIGAKTDV